MVWHGSVWCGMAQAWLRHGSGTVWHGMVWHDVALHGMAWFGMAWRGMAFRGVAWRFMAWNGSVWGGVVRIKRQRGKKQGEGCGGMEGIN